MTKIIFKKLLLIIGLMVVFSFLFQQDFGTHNQDALSYDATVAMQLDKDHHRDAADEALITSVFNHPSLPSSYTQYSHSVGYQEPSLLVHLRPPNR